MNSEFIFKRMWRAHYCKKPTTSTSFIHQSFKSIDTIGDRSVRERAKQDKLAENDLRLPILLTITKGDDVAKIAYKGRGTKERAGQLKGSFTKPESSIYKRFPPYKVFTSLWEANGHKCIFWGTIGITQGEGCAPKDNGDLIVIFTADWKEVEVFVFSGLASPNLIANTEEVFEFVDRMVVKG